MKRNGIRVLLLLAIIASLGGVTYKVAEQIWLMKAREIRKNPLKLLDYVPEAALQVTDFHHTKIEEGRKVWEVFGEGASYLKEQKEAVVKKPRIIFYDKNGESIKATGNKGHLFFADKGARREMDKAQLQGGIQVNYKGFVLQTDEIVYQNSTNRLFAPGKVTLKGDGLELEGVGMEIGLQDEKIRLLQKVRTRLQPDQLRDMKGKDRWKEGS